MTEQAPLDRGGVPTGHGPTIEVVGLVDNRFHRMSETIVVRKGAYDREVMDCVGWFTKKTATHYMKIAQVMQPGGPAAQIASEEVRKAKAVSYCVSEDTHKKKEAAKCRGKGGDNRETVNEKETRAVRTKQVAHAAPLPTGLAQYHQTPTTDRYRTLHQLQKRFVRIAFNPT
ncbi:hypothetical protein Bbelb_241040 [Branchiostoma belcheri]|nr:hypothetical protein Bbelb_241040 [Branchiostoma belcheri]